MRRMTGAAITDYLVRFLRFDARNVISVPNATKAQLDLLFRPGGRLSSRVLEGRSNVFVFYSGHGVPDPVSHQQYLLPTDVSPDSPEDGYSLETLSQHPELANE